MRRVTVREGLGLLSSSGRALAQARGVALRLHERGALTSAMRAEVANAAERQHKLEMAVYRALLTLLPRATALALPVPRRLPALPEAQIINGRRVRGAPDSAESKVALPVWAVLVLAAIAATGLVVIVLGSLYLGSDLVVEMWAIEADTRRLRARYVQALEAFERCLSTRMQGDDAALSCARAAGLLAPVGPLARPVADPNRSSWWTPAALCGAFAVAIGAGYWAWRRSSGAAQ